MTPANAIATTEALLPDGSAVAYRDADPSHIREQRFRHILESNPVAFKVVMQDGATFGVDLVRGILSANAMDFAPQEPPTTALRLIYYKRMHADSGPDGISAPVMDYFVVGWQTTLENGRNFKIGLKVAPSQVRFEVTEDI